MRVYWWRERANFGDRLAPHLLLHFTRVMPEWSNPHRAELVVTGSVIEHLCREWDGTILGAGKLYETPTNAASNAKVLAVRGPLTAKHFRGDFALGDPGLLADELVEVETKKYNLGIVPHWSDKTLAADPRFQMYNPVIINPMDDPLEVIKLIGECRKIVSSSLHGIIVADAFGIPRRTETTPQFQKEGGHFKFRDYNGAVGLPFVVGETQRPSRHRIEDRKHELYDCFRELA